jgi:hypothetical protein
MLRSMKDLTKYTFKAKDGDVGRVHDFYFDDSTWTVRYLVVDTGRWLPGRQVLLSPQSIERMDWEAREIHLDLSRKKIEDGPQPAQDSPVSRQHEQELHAHYGWEAYWLAVPGAMGTAAAAPHVRTSPAGSSREAEGLDSEGDPNLRSLREVTQYDIEATDGSIGVVDDLLCEDDLWVIRYLTVDTRKWLPGKSVLLARDWVDEIDWAKHHVKVNLSRDKLKNSPAFDPTAPVNRQYEERLYDFYGRPRYWSREREPSTS